MEIDKIKAQLEEIWSVKYIPAKIEDLAANDNIKNMVKNCIDTGNIPNHICLYGLPGTGKNSIVNIVKTRLDTNMLIINASEETGIDTIRGKVLGFANSGALFNKPKVIVMNEADGLSNQAQDSMKELMETKANRCRFIFTCNDINQIIPPLKSRFTVYKIDPPIKEVIKRLAVILSKEKIEFTKEFLLKFVKTTGRDLRKLLNDAQVLSKEYGKLTEDIIENINSDYTIFFDEIFNIKDLKLIGEKIKNEAFDENIYSILKDYCIEKNFTANTIPIIAEHSYRSNFIYDKDLVFMSCLLQLKDIVKLK
jgi:DNA polymerase III delta prime subunit